MKVFCYKKVEERWKVYDNCKQSMGKISDRQRGVEKLYSV